LSITAWFKTSTTGVTDVLVGKLIGGVGYQVSLQGSDNQVRVIIRNTLGNIFVDTVGANVRDDGFHHIAITYDGSSSASGVAIYIDGVLATLASPPPSDTLSSGTIKNNVALTIGNKHPSAGLFFDGQIDDVRIFNFELTVGQVTSLFGS